jgi:hypothetical protein
MPSGRNWLNFIFVNLGFVLQFMLVYYWIMKAAILKDWNKYRCNPMYMPLSDNVSQDFVFCVQKIQTNYIGNLLQPLTSITSALTDFGGELGKDINGANNMISNVRTYVTDITSNMFGVFYNLTTEFQKTSINIKDLAGKIIGIMTTAMYVMDGSNRTVVSMWRGPPGKIVRALGSCFHPETQVKLKTGDFVFMKDLELGSILENGSCVESVMKIRNTFNEPFYKLSNSRTTGLDTYVTGSHLVKHGDNFIQVRDHPCASMQSPDKNAKWFSCLITGDHKIPIGDYTFWDWEDDIITCMPHL